MKVDRGEGIGDVLTADSDGLLKHECILQDGVPMAHIFFGGVSVYATSEEMLTLLAEMRYISDSLDNYERQHGRDVEDYKRLYRKFNGVNPVASEGPVVTRKLTSSQPQAQTLPRMERHCSVCGELQFHTDGGWTCKNGHGGADSLEERQEDKDRDYDFY